MIGAIAAHYAEAAAPSGYAAEVLADNPLGYWRLGETSGTVMTDASGNGRNGVYENGPGLGATGLLTGDSDKAVDFVGAGSTARGRVPFGSWMNVSSVTVEAVVNLDVTTEQMIVERDPQTGGGGVRPWHFRVYLNKFEFVLNGGAVTTSVGTISAGTTYHLAATYDGVSAKLYINGALDTTVTWGGALSTSLTHPIWIGLSSFANIWPVNGRIDEVAVYPTTLSAGRIAAHYAAGI